MIAILAGAPGAGKGTQGELLARHNGFRKVSTGDALRNQIKLRTEIGRLAEGYVTEGKLVPDHVLFDILKVELGRNSSEKILLDGYPRNPSQAQALDDLRTVHPVACLVHLDVPRNVLIERLAGRRVCAQCGATYHMSSRPPKRAGICDNCQGEVVQRADDRPEKISTRLDVFAEMTQPVFEFYKRHGIYHQVDGQGAETAVFSKVQGIVESAVSVLVAQPKQMR